jgi:GR25 family glycosyltransferase involved in LPS biosynthesis
MKGACTDKFSRNYMLQLQKAELVLEISPDNIDFYKNKIDPKKINHCFMPFYDLYNVDVSIARKYDLVFVGAYNEKRKWALDAIQKQMKGYNILVTHNTYNDDRDRLLKDAKYVLNIHYYDNAVLEIERFNNAINCGCLVLSESVTGDDYMRNCYDFFVKYFDLKNMDETVAFLKYQLQDEVYLKNMEHFETEKRKLQEISAFYMHKSLVAANAKVSQYINYPIDSDVYVLSLTEDNSRLKLFMQQSDIPIFELFPAVKYKNGFIGCGMSYVTIAHNCLKNNKENVMIIEDDAVLHNNFGKRLDLVKEFLVTVPWDVLNGYVCCIETIGDIIGYYTYKGETYLKLRKMVGTVCNLYNKRALQRICEYKLHDAKQKPNYHIDRFINFEDINIIVPYPYLVDIGVVNSTIMNSNDMVAYKWFKNEERKTSKLIEAFLKSNQPMALQQPLHEST